jgi:FG-GAP-like repeat
MFFRCLVISAAAAILCAASATSQSVAFDSTTYPYNLWNEQAGPNGTVHADLNGDGREDFVTVNGDGFASNCAGSFAVTLSTGDGKYAAPVCYTLPSGNAALFAAGDFYNNGLLHLAVVNDQGTLFIYQNNGTGALTLANNSFELEGIPAGLVAADVNHDGITDLLYVLNPSGGGTTSTLYALLGAGGGTFTPPGVITAFSMNNEPAWALFIGDFDNDSNTDIMVEGASQVEDEILYGNGEGGFTAGPIVGGTAPKYTAYANFDIDSDGTMDLIGAPFTGNPEGANTYYHTLDIEWGHSNRTLTSQTVTLKNCTASGAPPVVADFNEDGNNDILVVEAADCTGDGPYTLNVMLGNGNGTFQPEQVVYSSSDWIAEWHVMRASQSSKPDVTLWQAQLVDGNEISNQEEEVLVNTTSGGFPSCTPSNFSATGINVCSPTSTTGATSPVTFSFGGSNQTAGRDMELWIDGTKVDENLKETYSHYSFLNATEALSEGEHTVTAYEVGWDYTNKSTTFELNVGSNTCSPPSSDGLNICSPINGSTAASPVLAQASGKVSGTILRMEVWVDGVKEYSTFGSDTLKTSITLAPGMHMFTYYAVNTEGELWSQATYAAVP